MRSLYKLAHFATLITLINFTLSGVVSACPGTTLTKSFSWPPLSLVHIVNSGVPVSAVDSGMSGWNAMNRLHMCFGPTFIADNVAGGKQINLSFTLLQPIPGRPGVTRGITHLQSAGFILGRMVEVDIEINSAMTVNSTIAEVVAHELGHTQALADCNQCGFHSSVMESGDRVSDINDSVNLQVRTVCDILLVESVATDYACPPPPPGGCNGVADFVTYPSTGCQLGFTNSNGTCTRSAQFQRRCAEPSGYDPERCNCPDGINPSPIVVDVDGTGFSLTDAAHGVVYDILDDGVPLPLSWTAPDTTNSFLVLDRNGDGLINNGAELFGDLTPQPLTSNPNGFVALAVYDQHRNGGNGDGRIDLRDRIFSRLELWQDSNHNGNSEATELRPLSEQIKAIDLDYRESRRVDQHGNQFRYRAKVFGRNGSQAGRWAWDVFLTVN